jgi:hypothetical protein
VKERRCSACGRLFQPCPKVKDQQYCSEHSCQKERKRRWQKQKRAEDPAYNANQRDAQKRWRESHPEYWRDYRKRHSDYQGCNRERQRERNRLKRGRSEQIAKMDSINVKIEVIPRC